MAYDPQSHDYRAESPNFWLGVAGALLILGGFGWGFAGFLSGVYRDMKLLPEPVAGKLLDYEPSGEGYATYLVAEFQYEGRLYTLDSREQSVSSLKLKGKKLPLREVCNDDYSTISIYVDPESPQQSRIDRRAGGGLMVICGAVLLIWCGMLGWVLRCVYRHFRQQ